jgi:sulfate permease, SulP family
MIKAMWKGLVPGWIAGYSRDWLRPDLVAGVVIWSVVTPQAVAYAQIAGLPAQAGLMAAPGALIAYALLGTSRQLVVSATTATAAVSAATVGPLAHGDPARFAALSAALAIVVAAVLGLGGALRLGAVADLVSKPVMTGFLFGLGLTISIAQLPGIFGVPAGSGNFFPQLWDLLGHLDDTATTTLAVGAGSLAVLLLSRRLLPQIPSTLLVLVLAIAASSLLHLDRHGVEVVGGIPDALPDPAVPDVNADDIVKLITPAFGVLILSAEAVGVARQLAVKHGYRVDANRDLMALGAGNLLAGLSSGFVQSGGASQTAAADGAGGRTQLASIVCAGMLLLTGAFLAPLFEDLPQATLAAIVVVAVAGFCDVAELRRFATIRRSALLFALAALAGVLVLGVLQGLVVAAGLSLVYVALRLSRPSVGALGRDPDSGAWGWLDRHPGWTAPPGVLVIRSDGPLFYPNADSVRERVLEQVAGAEPRPDVVVLDLSQSVELDLQSVDVIAELARQLRAEGVALRLAAVRAPAAVILERAGVTPGVAASPTVSAAVGDAVSRPAR